MDIIQERGISSTDLPNPPPVTDIVKNHENTFYLWTVCIIKYLFIVFSFF